MSGDDLRSITNFHKYEKKDRLEFSKTKLKFYKFITDQKINLIFSTISLFKSVRKANKRNIDNYVEIYIEADVEEIIKNKKKKLYKKKKKKIWGVNIKAEFPKKPFIKVKSNFNKPLNEVANNLAKLIFKKIKY